MARVFSAYALADSPHQQATSTGTANVATIAVPAEKAGRTVGGFYLTATTTAARVVFDGTTPSATNGVVVPAGVAPVFFPFRPTSIKFLSTAAADSVVDAVFLS